MIPERIIFVSRGITVVREKDRRQQRITGLKVAEGVRFEVLTAVVKKISAVHLV